MPEIPVPPSIPTSKTAPTPEPKTASPEPSKAVPPTPQEELHGALVEETVLMESLAKQTKVRAVAEFKHDAWKKTQVHK